MRVFDPRFALGFFIKRGQCGVESMVALTENISGGCYKTDRFDRLRFVYSNLV